MYESKVYHLYAHANAKDNFFNHDIDRSIFVSKVYKYISRIGKILAICIEKNHFHIVIILKDELEMHNSIVESANKKYSYFNVTEIEKYVSKYQDQDLYVKQILKNLFISYAKTFNIKSERSGCLFRRSFKIKLVDSAEYLSYLIFYVHCNPVKDGFSKYMDGWEWSSYNLYKNGLKNKYYDKEFVLNHFGGIENFIKYHEENIELIYQKKEVSELAKKFLKEFKGF